MTIFAIGHDIVENKRIAKLIDKYSNKFIDKILSQTEKEILKSKHNKARFIAKRFAAKEAFAKACGTGFRAPILMPKISVQNNQFGKPFFLLDTDIISWLEKQQIKHYHLSISDEIHISSAFVILEK